MTAGPFPETKDLIAVWYAVAGRQSASLAERDHLTREAARLNAALR